MLWSERLALGALLLSLSACGFQLRGETRIPPELTKTYISTPDSHSHFYRKFSAALRNAGAELVESPLDATAVFSILGDVTDQRVISVSARNVPTEYEVFYTVNYELRSGEAILLEPQSQTVTRDYNYDETLVLGKAREEELLRNAIADDLVRLILVQISAL